MSFFRRFAFATLAVLIATSSPAYAKKAQLLLFPTRIVLEKGERSATVSIKNSGDGVGSYKVEIIDMVMPEEGAVRELKPDEKDPYSLLAMTRVSPRRITLKPGESQNVRLLLRFPKNLEEGEYRSHFKVTLADDDVEKTTEQAQHSQNVAISIKPRLSLIIPVILRQGKTSFTTEIEHIALNYKPTDVKGQKEQRPFLDVDFTLNGNRSSMGNVEVTHLDPSGKSTILKSLPGIAIYRGTPHKKISLPLSVPAGVNLKAGKIMVTYVSQDKGAEKMLASGELAL